MSRLGDILQEEVHGEIDAILAEAESRAARLVRDAEEKAAARLKSHQEELHFKALAATRRARSAAELNLSTARMEAKGRVIESVRKRALEAIEEIANRENYRDILERLAEEALRAVGLGKAVVVHPDDEERIHEWVMQKGLELRTDPGLRLGVRVVDASAKRSVENSLPERLERAWNALTFDVARQLWE
jgi:V/A-type H+-transporting ATPase subunit E